VDSYSLDHGPTSHFAGMGRRKKKKERQAAKAGTAQQKASIRDDETTCS